MICKICNQELQDNIRSISNHVRQKHGITYKQYYDSYIKTDTDGLCLVCKQPTNWRRTSYLKYCCSKCANLATKDNRENTMIQKYGNKSYLSVISTDERIKNNEKSGFGTDKFKEKIKTKYGVNSYLKYMSHDEHVLYGKLSHNIESYNKRKLTCLNSYGVEHPSQSIAIRKKSSKKYTYNNLSFDSSWELAYYIWLTDNNVKFEYQPEIKFEYMHNNEKHIYHPDFMVNDIYVEIKGTQFFINKDVNNKMINPFDRSQDELYEAKHQCMIENNVKIITDCNEYIKFVEEKYTKNYIELFRNDIPFPYINENLLDKTDLGIIHHFHKSIYEANRKNKPSPINAWNNKELVKKCALNRLKYIGRCKPSDILQGFNVSKIAPKISVFKPSLAEELIKQYLISYNEIFDPFSGFSGRMIGAKNCGKKYIGQDIHLEHINESNEIISYKNYKNCYLKTQDILTDSNKTYECLFTCPPYGGKEHWNKDNDEIELSCDEWIDICLNKYQCAAYLFVVDKTEKYKDYIVETLVNKSHFGTNNEYVVLIKKQKDI